MLGRITLWPFSHRDSAISLPSRLAFTPPLFAHTEPSSAGSKPLQCVISYSMPALWKQKRRDGIQSTTSTGGSEGDQNCPLILSLQLSQRRQGRTTAHDSHLERGVCTELIITSTTSTQIHKGRFIHKQPTSLLLGI